MALTKNLKRTGRAGADERLERIHQRENTILQTTAFFHAALSELKNVDPNWEEWYDDCENIPLVLHFDDWAFMRPIIDRIRQRISIIRGQR